MQDPVHELYETHVYPAMSHPLSDPAVSAVAAGLAGLKTPHPSNARVLEIGCCSGHNLIPLALRWPEGRFFGIDLAESSIREARERADLAGAGNVTFQGADLRNFKPEGGAFDFIIAHGFLSWVPDDVKAALFVFCREYLSPSGIATISFNLECGWTPRFPVVRKARAIQLAKECDIITALEILRMVTDAGSEEIAIIDDMLAKGPAILAFDDFGPVNDPWPLDRFVKVARNVGLRWLGESDPAQDHPCDPGDESVRQIFADSRDPLERNLALDSATGRTFRSGVLCRSDALLSMESVSEMIHGFSVRAGPAPTGLQEMELWNSINRFAPASVPLDEVGAVDDEMVVAGINSGWILPRIEAVRYDPTVPARPRLDAFRLLCARSGLPLVDAWHKPCSFPPAHYQVLMAMDGTRRCAELREYSERRCPELDFDRWLGHLARRGMFS